ncbi:hypothetical protein N0V85_006043 [Neurospora sp. IMI 360204]|nr:hypothetical protein N0V85_006043 [Neurospora sp. IMI 360204]
MCQIWYKFHYCSQGASYVSDNGWVNRAGGTYVRPYAREVMVRRECSGYRYRGCSGQQYVGGDTNEMRERFQEPRKKKKTLNVQWRIMAEESAPDRN